MIHHHHHLLLLQGGRKGVMMMRSSYFHFPLLHCLETNSDFLRKFHGFHSVDFRCFIGSEEDSISTLGFFQMYVSS